MKTEIEKLYPYQKRAIKRTRELLSEGYRPLIYAPTGAGKTVIAAEILASAVRKGDRTAPVVFVVHTLQLLEQSRERLKPLGVNVINIQSLLQAPDLFRDAKMVCFDECHHLKGSQWSKAVKLFPDAAIFGLSATPFSKQLEKVFDARVTAATIQELVQGGYILPISTATPSTDQLADLDVNDQIDGALAYNRLHRGLPAIHFEPSISLCKRAATQYEALGVSAKVITGKTPGPMREVILDQYRQGRIDVLVSPVLLTEGFDAPIAQVMIAGRAFKSDAFLHQAVGRVRRVYEGKSQAFVVDCTGCCDGRGANYFNSTDESLFCSLADATSNAVPSERREKAAMRRSRPPINWVDVEDWVFQRPNLADALTKAEYADMVEVLRRADERDAAADEAVRERKRERNRVANMTPERRERQRERERERGRKRWANMTPEQRERQREQGRLANMTPEQRERKRQRLRVANMTPERRERQRERDRERRANMTPEQRERRRDLHRERERARARERRANMTPEQRERRRAYNKTYKLTPEQRERKRERARERRAEAAERPK